MFTRSMLFISIFVVVTTSAHGESTLIDDPLSGSTVGTQDGSGAFTDGGWRSTGGRIVYDAGTLIEDGYFEAKMWGWTAPASGADKSHPLSGWQTEGQYGHYLEEGCFWNWRIGTGYNPFKVLASPAGLDSRVEARVGSNSAVNTGTPHVYRVEWKDGKASFFFDGAKLQEWTFGSFKLRYFVIGRDLQYGITNPAPVIGDVRVVNRAGGVNKPPTVDSGADRTITWPVDSVDLHGTVTDPDSSPSTTWSMQSGPGSALFGNASAVETTVSFTAPGTYVLRLEADDGVNSPVADMMTVTVNPEPANTPPSVDAGDDVTITLPVNSVSLDATVTDPDDTPSVAWSGPAGASFADGAATDTTVTFSTAGRFTLTLTANDGSNPPVSDSVTIQVLEAIVDTDSDGMDDDWELAMFGDLNHVAVEDADGDGYSNIQEYLAGSHPLIQDDTPESSAEKSETMVGCRFDNDRLFFPNWLSLTVIALAAYSIRIRRVRATVR